ncbi:hypothetical protein CEXT_320841 [Caerostris extrusa]|uniref:Pentatricopeptide repeat-containing protein n=1 Tax=Caerostris extrusa TaxID=172846 RepID=A0AAV4VY61_CAEEX|nr:hypothetical protein CEXT_320841 [Caerostris extrusa]
MVMKDFSGAEGFLETLQKFGSIQSLLSIFYANKGYMPLKSDFLSVCIMVMKDFSGAEVLKTQMTESASCNGPCSNSLSN